MFMFVRVPANELSGGVGGACERTARPAAGGFVLERHPLTDEAAEPVLGGFGEEAADGEEQMWDIKGFLEQRTDAGAQGGEELVGARGGDDDGQERMLGAETFEGVPTVPDRHVEVEDDQVHRKGFGDDEGFVAVGGGEDEEAFFGQDVSEGFTHAFVVVHDQDMELGRFCRRPFDRGTAVRARRMLFLGVHESKT